MALKMRPVLDHRMPTLATKAAFSKAVGNVSALHRKSNAMNQLETSSPRCLKDVRRLLNTEIKQIQRRLSRLERVYYGPTRTIHQECERVISPVKNVMKSVLIFECNSASNVEEIIRKCSVPGYKGNAEYAQLFREVYANIKQFMPDKIADVTSSCHKLLNMLNKYCVSFYDPRAREEEGYIETAAHYEEQIRSWRSHIETSLANAKDIFRRFKSSGITMSNLTPPVENFVAKHNLYKAFFLVMFADACTNIRNALSLMLAWIKTDETYPAFIRSDNLDMESLRGEKIKALRESRSKYHSMTFRLTQLEHDYSKLETGVQNLQDRKDSLIKEEEYLSKQLEEVVLETEFKEYRMEQFRSGSGDVSPELSSESYEMLVDDLTNLKEKYPIFQRQLETVRYKLAWIQKKSEQLEKAREDIASVQESLREAGEERKKKEKEYLDVEKSLKLARKIMLCKTSNDAVEKLFYSLPVQARHAKPAGHAKGPIEKAVKVISRMIEKDWHNLYRNLPFLPKRGSETIERDIQELSATGASVTLTTVSRRALERWRRHHRRPIVDDLKSALRQIKRLDVLKELEEELTPPPNPEDDEFGESRIPPVPPELVPYYELGERYDQLRAMNRL